MAGWIVVRPAGQIGGGYRTFNLTVTGGTTMNPSELSARQGDHVTISITSDTEGEVHLHGYDIPFDVKPGQMTTRSFTADKTCSCDIEWETTGHPLGTFTVAP